MRDDVLLGESSARSYHGLTLQPPPFRSLFAGDLWLVALPIIHISISQNHTTLETFTRHTARTTHDTQASTHGATRLAKGEAAKRVDALNELGIGVVGLDSAATALRTPPAAEAPGSAPLNHLAPVARRCWTMCVRHVGYVVERLVKNKGVELVQQLRADAALNVPIAQHVGALERGAADAIDVIAAQRRGCRPARTSTPSNIEQALSANVCRMSCRVVSYGRGG